MTDSEFREAYTSHKNVLYRFACRMSGSSAAAEDLVQDCFLILLRNPAAYRRERGALRGYLIGIIRNLALKRFRGEAVLYQLNDEIEITQPIDPEGLDRPAIVARALAALPPLQREVLILAEYEELSLDEIVRIVDAEQTAVKSRLHRARANLRRLLAPLLETKGVGYGAGR
jgi:RNA polymerase sigma-70 factor (ECF subfamily)